MHKCQNCGKEYEGNFCPDCGTKCEEDKTCPDCGATCSGSAKFCNNCGYNFTEKNSNRRKKGTKASEMSTSAFALKVHKFIEYLPIVLFAVFAVALFALFALPVAVMPGVEIFGEKIPTESYGNMYQMYKGIYKDIPAIQGVAIANILIAAYSLIIAFALCIVAFIRPLKYKRVNLFGIKNAVRLSEIIEWMAGFVYVLFIALTAAIIGKISAFDSGLELISSGACVIIILALSCLFLLIHISFRLFEKTFMDKKAPELSVKSQGERYFNGEYAVAGAYKPVTPEPIENLELYKKIINFKKLNRAALTALIPLAPLILLISIPFIFEPNMAFCYFVIVIGLCGPALIAIITLFCPIKRVNKTKITSYGKWNLISIFIILIAIGAVIEYGTIAYLRATNNLKTSAFINFNMIFAVDFCLFCGILIYSVIHSKNLFLEVKSQIKNKPRYHPTSLNNSLKEELSSEVDTYIKNLNVAYHDYVKCVEHSIKYKLQLNWYLNGKDNYMLKEPSKFSVWLNRNCKLIIATVIGYVLYAITAIVILLPL